MSATAQNLPRLRIGHARRIPDGRVVALVRQDLETVGAGYGITEMNAYAMATIAAQRFEATHPAQIAVPAVGNCATWKGGVL
jgi:hypothetical protein